MSLSPTTGAEFSWRTKQKKIKVRTNDQSHLGSNNWAGQWWDGCSHLFIQPLGPEDSVPMLLSQPGPPSRSSGSRGEDGQNMKQKREWKEQFFHRKREKCDNWVLNAGQVRGLKRLCWGHSEISCRGERGASPAPIPVYVARHRHRGAEDCPRQNLTLSEWMIERRPAWLQEAEEKGGGGAVGQGHGRWTVTMPCTSCCETQFSPHSVP